MSSTASLPTILILLLPHEGQHPGSIADVCADNGMVDAAEQFEDRASLGRMLRFGAGDERRPQQAFEVLVFSRDKAELANQRVRHGSVVRRESNAGAGRDGCGRRAGSGLG